MKLSDCTQAYPALLALMEQPMDYKSAYALVRLKAVLQPKAEFYAKEEMKLVEACAERDEDGKVLWTGKGSFRFADDTAAATYTEKRKELDEIQVEAMEKIRIPAPKSISPAQLEALLPFVEVET